MGDVIAFKKPAAKAKANRNHILCKEGHHRWKIVQEKRFETHSGQLMTVYRCERCQKTKSQLL